MTKRIVICRRLKALTLSIECVTCSIHRTIKRLYWKVSICAFLFLDWCDHVFTQNFMILVRISKVVVLFLNPVVDLNKKVIVCNETTCYERLEEAGDWLGFLIENVFGNDVRDIYSLNIFSFIIKNSHIKLSVILICNCKHLSITTLFN